MLVILIGVGEAIVIAGVLFVLQKTQSGGSGALVAKLQEEVNQRSTMISEFQELYGKMIPWEDIRERVRNLSTYRDALKLERGRVTITQAELETVETRLRELDEIEREIQASGLETKEELRILNKKEKDLATKNDSLKTQITNSMQQLESILGQIELSAQMQSQVSNMKSELLQTEQKIDLLLLQIEQGNEQYFILKQTYDALDIEYAQLYERFSEVEAAMNQGKKD